MELRQIRYFIEVAKREHVTEASHALHVAQSAVSRQIFNLESELGVDLFIREGRNVKLTPIGAIFLEHMEQALLVIDTAKQDIKEYLDPERGTIRIGFPSSLASQTLPMVVSAFRKKHPQVKFQLRQGSYQHLIEAVIKGEINLALLGPMPVNENKINSHALFTEKIVALLPRNHPLANEKSIRLRQLHDDSFVLFPEGFVLRKIVVDACKQQGFEPEISFEGNDIDALKGLVAAGLGVTLLPEITLVDNIPRATIEIPINDSEINRTVGIITPANRELAPTEQIFHEFVKQFFDVLSDFGV